MLAPLWPFLAFSFVDLLMESDMIPTSLQPDGLFIIGEASRSIAPDIAELALFIITYGVTAMDAMNESAARVQYIGQAIVSAGSIVQTPGASSQTNARPTHIDKRSTNY